MAPMIYTGLLEVSVGYLRINSQVETVINKLYKFVRLQSQPGLKLRQLVLPHSCDKLLITATSSSGQKSFCGRQQRFL